MHTLKLALTSLVIAFFLMPTKEKPVLYIIGDSTVKNSTGHTDQSLWGWGSLLHTQFDTTKISVENHAIGGRSSRTFINEGRWDKVLATLKKGDFVLIQFGHNDAGPLADTARARGTLKGIGTESSSIYNPKLHVQEVVHTYGWYLRKYIADAKSKGAIPMVCSPVPRNSWANNKVNGSDYVDWAKQVAMAEGALYIPLNETISASYETVGAEQVKLFFPVDHTHTNKAGAALNAKLLAQALKTIPKASLKQYLKQNN